MVKANELRIGNFIQGMEMSVPRLGFFSDGIQKIQSLGIHLIDSNQWVVEPIPLTEEWLKRFGFYTNAIEYGIYKQPDGANAYSLKDDVGDGSIYYIGHVEYVHQLQNLYFSMTGRELTLPEQQ